MNHPFRKKWGQNFLSDSNLIDKIVKILDINKNDSVLEIAAVLANINSPVPADVKDHHFQHSVLNILHR